MTGDRVRGGARQDQRDPARVFTPPYDVHVAPADDALAAAITTHAGAGAAVPATGPWRPLEDDP